MKKFIKQDIEAVWNSKTFVSAGLSFKICFDITVYYDDDAHPTPENPAYNEFIFEIASSGKRSYVKNQRDNYFDTSILPSHSVLHKENFDPLKDTDKHTPAHEFGHLYGLADRYHYYQRMKDPYTIQLLEYSTDQKKKNYVTTDYYCSVPMYLPLGGDEPIYDIDYDWKTNLLNNTLRHPY